MERTPCAPSEERKALPYPARTDTRAANGQRAPTDLSFEGFVTGLVMICIFITPISSGLEDTIHLQTQNSPDFERQF